MRLGIVHLRLHVLSQRLLRRSDLHDTVTRDLRYRGFDLRRVRYAC